VLVFRASHALKHQINNGPNQPASGTTSTTTVRAGAAKSAPA
jgi:hypothetical protein